LSPIVTLPDRLRAGVGVDVRGADEVTRALGSSVAWSVALGAAVLVHALTTATHAARASKRDRDT